MTSPDRPQLLIFTALQAERRAVERALHKAGAGPSTILSIGDFTLFVKCQTIGVAAVHLPPAPPPAGTAGVLIAGFGGALDPSLRVGDVVIDWDAGADPPPGLRRGAIASADGMLATPTGKANFYRQTGAAVVDMESTAVRRWAGRTGTPVLGIRAITDLAHQAIDPAVLGLVDPTGRPRPVAIARYLLGSPPSIRRRAAELRRLGAAAHLAARQLESAVHRLLLSPALAAWLKPPSGASP